MMPDLHDAMSYIPADDREVWYTVGMALKAEQGDAGLEPWLRWSAQSAKFDEKVARAQWKSFKTSRARMVRGGTIFHLAKATRVEAAPADRRRTPGVEREAAGG